MKSRKERIGRRFRQSSKRDRSDDSRPMVSKTKKRPEPKVEPVKKSGDPDPIRGRGRRKNRALEDLLAQDNIISESSYDDKLRLFDLVEELSGSESLFAFCGC